MKHTKIASLLYNAVFVAALAAILAFCSLTFRNADCHGENAVLVVLLVVIASAAILLLAYAVNLELESAIACPYVETAQRDKQKTVFVHKNNILPFIRFCKRHHIRIYGAELSYRGRKRILGQNFRLF